MSCPNCKSNKIIKGKIYNQPDYVAPRAYFRPEGLNFFSILWSNVRLDNNFFSCLDCGFMWGKLNNKELIKVLSNSGTTQTKKKLGLE